MSLPVAGLAAAQVCLAHRVPAGDPAQLRATARQSGAFAAELGHSADVLLASAESSLWRGPAHRALAERLSSHAPQLRATADRYRDYADALFSYASVLDETAATLHGTRRILRHRSDELTSRASCLASQLPTSGAPPADPGADLLPAARAFKASYDRWADALERCVRALRRADQDDPTRDRHGFRAFAHQVGHAAAAAVSPFERAMLHPTLHNISACLGELNAGLSLLGLGLLLICPPAAAACLAAATVLAVAQLAVDSTRRAQGESVSDTSLGLELASAIPLGGGAFRSLRAAEDVVHLVPGGGLMAHEGVNRGHTLAKHVGKSEAFLRNRLATEPGIRGASTLYDRQTAEASIAGVLRTQQRTVTSWLSGRRAELVLRGRLPVPVGIVISREDSNPAAAHGIKIVLRRNAGVKSGYLLTHYCDGDRMSDLDALHHLSSAYLHEDFADLYGSAWGAVDTYARNEPEYAPQLRRDITRLLSTYKTEAGLEDALTHLGLDYLPTGDGWADHRTWLLAVANRVEEILHKSPAA